MIAIPANYRAQRIARRRERRHEHKLLRHEHKRPASHVLAGRRLTWPIVRAILIRSAVRGLAYALAIIAALALWLVVRAPILDRTAAPIGAVSTPCVRNWRTCERGV